MIKTTLLDSNLKLRATTWADVNAVADLIYTVCEADGDVTVATTAEELEHEWKNSEGFNPETDSFVVTTEDGRVVGYVEVFNAKDHADLNIDGYFHPQFKSVGRMLMKRAVDHASLHVALAAPDVRVFVRSTIDGKDENGKRVHTDLGFSIVRYNWRMEIDLNSAPAPVTFPTGIELRPFDRDAHARLVWEAQNDSFSEHWGMVPKPFEAWAGRRFDLSDFDPTLWLVAWDGDKIAGFSQNRYRAGIGWIGTLGVLKPWRKCGLGLALLKHSFGEFYKRGTTTIGLGVDASNTTGATRLYERAGMYIASEFVTFEKELRPGRSLDEG